MAWDRLKWRREYYAKNKARIRALNLATYYRHRNKRLKKHKEWEQSAVGKEWKRRWAEKNRESERERYRRSYETHKAAKRKDARERAMRHNKTLSDGYVRGVLSHGTTLKRSDWPKVVVETKRAELTLRRWLRDN